MNWAQAASLRQRVFGNIGVQAASSHHREEGVNIPKSPLGQMKYLKELGFLVWHIFYIEKI